NEAVSLTAREVQSLEQQFQRLNLETSTKWIDLQNKLNNQQFNVVVTGPEAVQPGARNEYQIRTLELGRPVSATVATRVLDENRKTIFEKNGMIGPSGTAAFFLPRDLPVTPQNKLFLEIVAERDGGQKKEIHEVLSLVAPVYLTHLATDKPMYRPGETVYFRSLPLERY